MRRWMLKILLRDGERLTLSTWYRELAQSEYGPIDVDDRLRKVLSLPDTCSAR